MPPTTKPQPKSFAEHVNRLHADLLRDGVSVADMRRAPAMELQFAGAGEIGRPVAHSKPGFEPLEGPIAAREVPRVAPRDSRLHYFLDGTQRTFAVWRCGLVPISATITAAAVLQRQPTGDGTIASGTLRIEHCWLIPEIADPRIDDLRARITDLGMQMVDPRGVELDGEFDESDIDFGRLHEQAYVAARKVREKTEERVLSDWVERPEWSEDEGWIVVDGRLRTPSARTIGLVKQFRDSYLVGQDAETLLGLPPGYRTTAFLPEQRRFGPDSEARTLWYLRLWDAEGMDARHALVRIEAPRSVCTTDEIDRISGWILAERTPRATGDSRWATLLYPVHLLEEILKRRLDVDTRGWPGA